MKIPPAIRFLLVFVTLYLVLNMLYGFWVEAWNPLADPATAIVGRQSAWCLNQLGYNVSLQPLSDRPLIAFLSAETVVINLFEGCNGLNVMIVFVAFLLAYGGKAQRLVPFIAMGLVCIHLLNLTRVSLLFWLAETQSQWFYYFHKYLFTGFLFAFVFLGWWIWIKWGHE